MNDKDDDIAYEDSGKTLLPVVLWVLFGALAVLVLWGPEFLILGLFIGAATSIIPIVWEMLGKVLKALFPWVCGMVIVLFVLAVLG